MEWELLSQGYTAEYLLAASNWYSTVTTTMMMKKQGRHQRTNTSEETNLEKWAQ